jgi:hypothetical protein
MVSVCEFEGQKSCTSVEDEDSRVNAITRELETLETGEARSCKREEEERALRQL